MDSETFLSIAKAFAVVGSVAIMFYGTNRIYARLKQQGQGFGANSTKALGMMLFIPTIIILSILTDFRTETLAALLGTVAGYVLSSSKQD